MSSKVVSSCTASFRVRRGAPEGAQPARVGLASASSAVTRRTFRVWLHTNCLAPAHVRSTAATPLRLPQNTRYEHNSCQVAGASLLLRLPPQARAPWPARSRLAGTPPPTPITRVAAPCGFWKVATHLRCQSLLHRSQARPNPSLKGTRYGSVCKAGLWYSVHCHKPALQTLPPRAP
jgi:hypothetical protein